ncbi:MAG TPA: type IX secretion system membrane protein PorP/SprF [Chryseolinea sp.]|nr:type IX secretion system membrane protein PorP/SprF [Chryseolinea sp.]
MRTPRILVMFVGLWMTGAPLLAQQNSLFTQYMFNGLVINPAYTGSHESMTATAASRSQWTGLKGAPQTQVASLHSPIKFSRSAAGALLLHDQVGVTNQYMVYGTYAYHIPVSKNAKLAVGGQAGVTYYQANLSELNIVTQNNQADPTFARNDSRFLPNLGIGAYYYSKRTYVGLSLPTLINNKWNSQDANTARQKRHYFLSAGHIIDLGTNVKFKPNVLLRWEEGGPFQYDINANVLFHNVIWVGVSYRMNDAIDGLLELVINNQLNIGYSYGYPTTALAVTQSGTHEFVLNYRIKRNKNIVFSPRYF